MFGRLDLLGAELARIDRDGARDLAEPRFVRYLAWIDGEAVAAATATFTDAGAVLHAGSTKAAARGRGAYRALLAALWEDAVRRGAPRVVTRAGPMSRPILRRVGFQELAEIDFLVDRFG
ncbi:GNAT family N-acetyltransferase [Sorangium sp. So ce296]|uniref:GNAT family N-acetyltransferase n=1 Tax=Sorangium sp. So ce296 TaxID=3133296 RepID=UPI003F5DEC51